MIDLVIAQRRRDLGGGMEVGRMLPFAKRRMVGPVAMAWRQAGQSISANPTRTQTHASSSSQ